MHPIARRRYDATVRSVSGVTVEHHESAVETVEMTSHEAARLAADALSEKKGLDILLLDVADLLAITDVFVIVTGTSRPHVQTLAEFVEEKLKGVGRRPLREEGRAEAEWVLLDFGDFVLHVFQPEQRDYYGLERLWSDAPTVDWQPVADPAPGPR